MLPAWQLQGLDSPKVWPIFLASIQREIDTTDGSNSLSLGRAFSHSLPLLPTLRVKVQAERGREWVGAKGRGGKRKGGEEKRERRGHLYVCTASKIFHSYLCITLH